MDCICAALWYLLSSPASALSFQSRRVPECEFHYEDDLLLMRWQRESCFFVKRVRTQSPVALARLEAPAFHHGCWEEQAAHQGQEGGQEEGGAQSLPSGTGSEVREAL